MDRWLREPGPHISLAPDLGRSELVQTQPAHHRQLGGSLGIAVFETVAATVTKSQLAGSPPTHAAINHAVTAGYGAAFEIASLIAFAGFLVALAVIRGGRTASTQEADGAAA